MEHSATLFFFGGLVDFLPRRLRGEESHTVEFNGTPAVKDTIESVGVPHPEICAVKIDEAWAPLSLKLRNGERVEVYPFGEPSCPSVFSRRLVPGGEPAFAVDGNLGTLVRRLRLLGFDTLFLNDTPDARIAEITAAEGRILLTRDRGLLRHKVVEYGYWVRSDDPAEQILEVSKRYFLKPYFRPFSRCIRCNGKIEATSRESVKDRLLPVAREHYDTFFICTGCHQIFWEGPHHAKMLAFVEELRRSLPPW